MKTLQKPGAEKAVAGKQRIGGRPPRKDKPQRTTIYLSQATKRILFKRASERGVSLSRELEDLILAANPS